MKKTALNNVDTKLDIIEKELHEFELKYDLSSEEFCKKFNQGELDDRTDFIDWYSLVDTREKLLQVEKSRDEMKRGELYGWESFKEIVDE